MRFQFLRPVTAYSRVIFAQISGDFEDGVAVSSYNKTIQTFSNKEILWPVLWTFLDQ